MLRRTTAGAGFSVMAIDGAAVASMPSAHSKPGTPDTTCHTTGLCSVNALMPTTSAPAGLVDRFMDEVRKLRRLDRLDDLVVDDCHLTVREVRTVCDGRRLTSHATRWWTPAACSTNWREADWRLLP